MIDKAKSKGLEGADLSFNSGSASCVKSGSLS